MSSPVGEALDYLALDETSSLAVALRGYLRRRRGF